MEASDRLPLPPANSTPESVPVRRLGDVVRVNLPAVMVEVPEDLVEPVGQAVVPVADSEAVQPTVSSVTPRMRAAQRREVFSTRIPTRRIL